MKNWLRTIILTVLAALAVAGTAKAETAEAGPYYSTPSWDQTFPASSRWIVLTNMNSAAVLDRETGLVWQQNPSTNLSQQWITAMSTCLSAAIGNRFGWRLPAAEELMTLIDPTTMTIFAGAPFAVNSGSLFWTTTTDAQTTGFALAFRTGGFLVSREKTGLVNAAFVWCVRGYQGTQNPQ